MRGLNNLKEYKIIFSDIDGTLLNNENQVPEETIEELRRLDSQGVPFVLVSARMPKGMRPIREELGIHAPMVCYSGGLVLDPDDQEIYSCLLDLDLACEIKSLVAKEFPEVVCGIYGGNTGSGRYQGSVGDPGTGNYPSDTGNRRYKGDFWKRGWHS